MTTAMVLCAGFGTRLKPLTDELPKPLVPLGDRPLLAHILKRLQGEGIERSVINVHYASDIFRRNIKILGVEVELVHEPELRGTAGGIQGATALLGAAPIIVHTGDILTEPPVTALLAAVDDGLCLAVRRQPAGQGPVGLDSAGRVVRLRGQCFGSEAYGAEYIGVSSLGERCLATLPAKGCLIQDWALPELRAGRSIGTVSVEKSFVDVGHLHQYLEANLAWLDDRRCFVAPGASVAPDVSVERCIVGQGARVVGSGRLTECVIWPGALAQAPLTRSVVTPAGRVVAIEPSG